MRAKRVPPTIRIVQTDERADVEWLITVLVACSAARPLSPPTDCAEPATSGMPVARLEQREPTRRHGDANPPLTVRSA